MQQYNEFKNKAQTARQMEISLVGVNPLKAVDYYKNVITYGKNLLETVDFDQKRKLEELEKEYDEKAKRKYTLNELIVTSFVTLVVGLLANYIWEYL